MKFNIFDVCIKVNQIPMPSLYLPSQVSDFREKNLDLMRPELISVLKNSQYSIVREVAGADPVAVFRWSILRAFFRAVSAFHGAAIKYTKRKGKSNEGCLVLLATYHWLCVAWILLHVFMGVHDG